MDVTMVGSGAPGSGIQPAEVRDRGAGVGLLFGSVLSLVGLMWDVQWHSDVGPDTFFTLPHLFLYAGSGLAGLVSLGVVLSTTSARRKGLPVDPRVGGRPVGVLGERFAAPVGYFVSGSGAALFLTYGLWDQWWHSLYGFDAVIDSPPHIGLLLSVTMTMIGTVLVFAAGDRGWGVVAGLSVLLAFSSVTVLAVKRIGGPVGWVSVLLAGMSVLGLVVAAGTLRRPGAATATAVGVGLIQLLGWWSAPWAARWYAGVVGLPVRDYVRGIAEMPALMPATLLGAAVVLEAGLALGRARSWSPRLVVPAGSLLAGAFLAATYPIQQAVIYGPGPTVQPVAPSVLVAAAVTGLAGWWGWQLGAMLRQIATAEGSR